MYLCPLIASAFIWRQAHSSSHPLFHSGHSPPPCFPLLQIKANLVLYPLCLSARDFFTILNGD